MDFKQLESFVEISKFNSFTKAAENLYLAQPTLTGHIQALENKLGTILFNRSGKKITLTEAGELLYNHAVNILNLREQAHYAMNQYQGKFQGELAIAASTVLQNYLLPELLTKFSREHPNVTFELRHFDSEQVIQAIITGVMDFGFVGTTAYHPELEMYDLGPDQLILITPPDEKIMGANDQSITWKQVCNHRFILREAGSATGGLFRSALEKKGLDISTLNVVARIESLHAVKQYVRQGLGVAVVSRRVVQEEISQNLLKGYTLEDLDLSRRFYFLNHRKRVLNPVSRAFKDFICQHYSAL